MADRELKAILRKGDSTLEIFDEKIAARIAEQLLPQEAPAKSVTTNDIRPDREKPIWPWDAPHLRGYLEVLKPNASRLVRALATSDSLRVSSDLAAELGFDHARAVGPIVNHLRGKAVGMGLEDPVELARDAKGNQCLTVSAPFRAAWTKLYPAQHPPPSAADMNDAIADAVAGIEKLMPPSPDVRTKIMKMALGWGPATKDREGTDG